jgi:hypothetical protein
MEQPDIFDTPAYKLVRKHDPETSHESAQSVDVNNMERIVLNIIQGFGASGCISDEVLDLVPYLRYSTVTARYKQLKEKGLIKVDHRKRRAKSGRNQLMMWATEFYVEEQDESCN